MWIFFILNNSYTINKEKNPQISSSKKEIKNTTAKKNQRDSLQKTINPYKSYTESDMESICQLFSDLIDILFSSYINTTENLKTFVKSEKSNRIEMDY